MSAPARPSRVDRVRPWAALLLPPLAWLAYEYGLGSSLRESCVAVGAWLGPAWGAASLAACLAAVVLARPLARRGDAQHPPAGAWLARIAMLVAGVFALAIAFQLLATLIVPSCAR